ncbi:MAG: ribosomal RNA small subunit methyltransferase A [Oligoflexia bacterium]|nr:ribosomal RNA small subunit methyltransferase A [Oligoflexia bacterium]
MHTKKELSEKLLQAKIVPLKSLGQNFLVNKEICEKIINKAKSLKPDFIYEIGPGLGALTSGFLDEQSKLVLVELDKGLVEYWQKQNLNIIHADALKLNWSELLKQHSSDNTLLVSNLPYSIAASLVIELSELSPTFKFMVLMFQKEVALRILAKVRDEDYGFLTVVANTFWRIEKLIDAGPQDFYPVPHVGSRVLCFTKQDTSIDKSKFINFVKLSFSQRRKYLIKNLSQQFDLSMLEKTFSNLGINPKSRAQDIDLLVFERLFKNLSI